MFEEKIKKPMEIYLHANSNVVSMNLLNTFVSNAMETSKLGDVGFYENDLFSSPALKKKICSDDTLSPICGNSNDTCDILNPHTESVPFKIPIEIVERVIITAILEMELSILVIIYSLYTNYVGCSRVQVLLQIKLRRSYSHCR